MTFRCRHMFMTGLGRSIVILDKKLQIGNCQRMTMCRRKERRRDRHETVGWLNQDFKGFHDSHLPAKRSLPRWRSSADQCASMVEIESMFLLMIITYLFFTEDFSFFVSVWLSFVEEERCLSFASDILACILIWCSGQSFFWLTGPSFWLSRIERACPFSSIWPGILFLHSSNYGGRHEDRRCIIPYQLFTLQLSFKSSETSDFSRLLLVSQYVTVAPQCIWLVISTVFIIPK